MVSYLEVSDYPNEEARLGILDALHTTMLHAWPRYFKDNFWTAMILFSLSSSSSSFYSHLFNYNTTTKLKIKLLTSYEPSSRAVLGEYWPDAVAVCARCLQKRRRVNIPSRARSVSLVVDCMASFLWAIGHRLVNIHNLGLTISKLWTVTFSAFFKNCFCFAQLQWISREREKLRKRTVSMAMVRNVKSPPKPANQNAPFILTIASHIINVHDHSLNIWNFIYWLSDSTI